MTKRRGLSSVVGGVFAIIAIITAIGYVTYSMNLLEKFNQSVLVRTEESIDRGKEEFDIVRANVVNDKLNITVQNSASLPVHLTRLWIENTTVSDSVFKYDIDEVVSSGRTVTDIGQNIAFNVDNADSYHIKLVTERGNSQQFTINSASSAPLNIQLLALPPTVSSGFTTGLVMVVTNNGSGTVTNLAPQTPFKSSGLATCTLGPVSPPSYDTLPPGGTAVFKWDLTVSGLAPKSCTYTAQLQNPYPGNTAQATVTLTTVKITSTNFATNAGVLSINYTSFQWSQGGGWNSGWNVPKGKDTVFSLQLANSNASNTIWLSKTTLLTFYAVSSSSSIPYYLVINVNETATPPTISQPYTCTGPPINEYCIGVPPEGSVTLYFAATSEGANSVSKFSNTVEQYTGFLVVFGKYSDTANSAGSQYGQNIPYIGLRVD